MEDGTLSMEEVLQRLVNEMGDLIVTIPNADTKKGQLVFFVDINCFEDLYKAFFKIKSQYCLIVSREARRPDYRICWIATKNRAKQIISL